MSILDEIFKDMDGRVNEMVEEMLKNSPPPEETSFESSEQIKQGARAVLVEVLTGKDIRDRIERGFEVLVRELKSYEPPVSLEAIKKDWVGYTDYVLKTVNKQELDFSLFEENIPLSEDTLQQFYGVGFRLYEHERYEEAGDVFFVISNIDYRRHNVWMLLGLCEKALSRFDQALVAFSMAILTDPQDPWAFLYSSECYIALGEKIDAEECVRAASDLIQVKSNSYSNSILVRLNELKKDLE